jgi:THO complex subunit 2
MLEQERIANEEAEKRLKAALTAKRGPDTTTSRTASPAVGISGSPDAEVKPVTTNEPEISMDVDPLVASSQKDEVSCYSLICRTLYLL